MSHHRCLVHNCSFYLYPPQPAAGIGFLCLAMEMRRWLLRPLALLTTTTALLLNTSTSTSSSISTAHDLPALLSFKSLITKDPLGALLMDNQQQLQWQYSWLLQ
uniref:Uncharacterized protein n=1 Tax=Aegilops tauschii subsp. strangulata TaxID=200361 RepID=A0A452ZG82_AEGTS